MGRFGQADLVFIIGKSFDEGNRLTEIIDAFRLWGESASRPWTPGYLPRSHSTTQLWCELFKERVDAYLVGRTDF